MVESGTILDFVCVICQQYKQVIKNFKNIDSQEPNLSKDELKQLLDTNFR